MHLWPRCICYYFTRKINNVEQTPPHVQRGYIDSIYKLHVKRKAAIIVDTGINNTGTWPPRGA